MGEIMEKARELIEDIAENEALHVKDIRELAQYGNHLGNVEIPSTREGCIAMLESADADARRMMDIKDRMDELLYETKGLVYKLAEAFPPSYDAERLVKAAKWFLVNVAKKKVSFPEAEMAEDGMAYLDECVRKALGEQQLFKIAAVMQCSSFAEIHVVFTIPETLGVWELLLSNTAQFQICQHPQHVPGQIHGAMRLPHADAIVLYLPAARRGG